MNTFLTVLSFPFWFLGVFITILGLFGKLTIHNRRPTFTEAVIFRLVLIVVGGLLLALAYWMI